MRCSDSDPGRPGDGSRVTGTSGTLYGSEGWGFESLRARQVKAPSSGGRGLFANAGANSGKPAETIARAKMSAASASWSLIAWAYTQRDRGVGVAKPTHAGRQSRRHRDQQAR